MISISCMDTILLLAAASSACLVYSYRVTMAGPVSVYSDLLTREENELLFSLLGGRVQVLNVCVCVCYYHLDCTDGV